MGRMISNGIDVVSFLKEQHEQIRDMFGLVRRTRGKEKEQAFFSLRRLLAVHETAEEEIIHPAARRVLANGDAIIDARLAEENEAKKVLARLEGFDIDSIEFDTDFNLLEQQVVAHAAAEEVQEFARLATVLDHDRLARMRRAAELAERMAPTRPHPGVESQAANMLLGPFASMMDRARDALSGKRPH